LSPSWYPQVILANASQIPVAQGVLLRVAPDGSCTLIQDLHAVARKELQLRRYPFDRQRLEAVFQILGFDRSEVLLLGDIMPHISYTTFINAFISLSFLLMGVTAAVNLLACLYDRNGNHALGDLIDKRSQWVFPTDYAALILLAFVTTFYFL